MYIDNIKSALGLPSKRSNEELPKFHTYNDLRDFYEAIYLPRHKDLRNKGVHVGATLTGVTGGIALASFGHPVIALLCIPVVYGALFASHRFLEGNTAATLEGYFLPSVYGDFRMTLETLRDLGKKVLNLKINTN